MKKDIIFTPALLLVGILLFLHSVTDDTAHIIISIIGILVLAVYTAATKKEWKIPALEILMRVCYGLALISGIVVLNVEDIPVLSVVHGIFAALFIVLLIVLFVHKLVAKKKA